MEGIEASSPNFIAPVQALMGYGPNPTIGTPDSVFSSQGSLGGGGGVPPRVQSDRNHAGVEARSLSSQVTPEVACKGPPASQMRAKRSLS